RRHQCSGVAAADLVDDLGEAGEQVGVAGGHEDLLVGKGIQGHRTTCPAAVSPAPNPRSSTGSPRRTSPVSSRRDRASGIEAALVLPLSTTSRATTTCDGSLSARTNDSVIRRF